MDQRELAGITRPLAPPRSAHAKAKFLGAVPR
jgi:hypothetical protein